MNEAFPDPQQPRSPVNWRSVLLGLSGVCFINALTPLNNHALVNTDMVGSYLPTGLLLFFVAFVMLVNGPLNRYAPHRAMRSSEMAVALGMALVGCALPFVGLMRYLPGHLTGLFYLAGQRADYAAVLRQIGLPDWLFPTMSSDDIVQRANDPVVRDYVGRAIADNDTFFAHVLAVPWGAWLVPCMTWGIFLVGLFGSVLCLMVVFRRQWVENERLQFPLATVYLALIEQPPPGRALNSLLGSRRFWIGFSAVFALHLFNGMAQYFPRNIPPIPLSFNLSAILSEEPWRYMERDAKLQHVYFTIIGLMFFVQTRTALSLWLVFILLQVARMTMGMRQSEMTVSMEFDQLFGAVLVFAGIIIWVARHHLMAVLRQMFAKARPGDPQGRYMPYRLAGWGFVACQLLLVGWVWAAGSGLLAAFITVGMLSMLYLVLAKVVADTGMIYALIPVPVSHPFEFAATALPVRARVGIGSYFFASWFSGFLTHDLRQALPPYALHAMAIGDRTAYSQTRDWRKAIPFIGALILALTVAYIVSGASTLYVEYTYAATLDRSNASPINHWGSQDMVRSVVMDPAVRYLNSGGTPVSHNRWSHLLLGAGITGVMGIMRLSFAWWPLHPVGFLMCYTWGLRQIWFSVFLGWLLKVLIVRFGGAKLFAQAQSLFIGLIIGEVMAAAWFLCLSLVLAMLGYEYRAIALLP